MKKILIPVIIVVVIIAAFLVHSMRKEAPPASDPSSSGGQPQAAKSPDTDNPDTDSGADEDDDSDYSSSETKSLAETYKDSAEALEAVKSGAKEYDDMVLEHFNRPGADCTWCPEFYKTLTERMLSPEATDDEQSYYGEILAISGRVENISTLVDAIKNAPSQEVADRFSEALELTIGDEKVISYLGTQLRSSENEDLKESLVAALTNHGSRSAIETLYSYTQESGTADGFYSLGIGLGEVIPDRDSLPLLAEYLSKNDNRSPLALKALFNSGSEGFEIGMNYLTNVKDPETLDRLIKDAKDHVSCDKENEVSAQKVANNPNNPPQLIDLAKQVLSSCSSEEE